MGQVICNVVNGDGDVLLVYFKLLEEQFVVDGFGVVWVDVMYNDFVIVGLLDDLVGIVGVLDVVFVLKLVVEMEVVFVLWGDDSGIYKVELCLWEVVGIDFIDVFRIWYWEIGFGMGVILNIGMGMGVYILIDWVIWIVFGNKQVYQIFVEGDLKFFN